MATDYFLTDGLAGVDLDDVDDSPKYDLGTLQWGAKGVYQYIKATGTIAAGRFVRVNKDFEGIALVTGITERIGVGVSCSNLSNGKFGWVWRGSGQFEGHVANGVAAGTALTATATGGEVGTGGTAIAGLVNVDAGVTDTRVTVFASTLMTSN